MDHSTFVWVAACIVAVLSVARTARLLIFDDLPPMVWLRSHIVSWYREDSKWSALWECPYCLSVWLVPFMVGWMWWSDLNTWWWLINGAWAMAYAAAYVVAYDEPGD